MYMYTYVCMYVRTLMHTFGQNAFIYMNILIANEYISKKFNNFALTLLCVYNAYTYFVYNIYLFFSISVYTRIFWGS